MKQIYVDKEVFVDGPNKGLAPIIVRDIEHTEDGLRHGSRLRCRSVRILGPSSVESCLEGDPPHVWIETQAELEITA